MSHALVPAFRQGGLFVWLTVLLLAGASPARAQGLGRWFLAEGATGAFFEEEILIGNPNAAVADVRITYFRPSGTPVVQTLTVAATSRVTIRVNQVPGVEDTAVSALVECTNGLDIVVERSMYWANGDKRGGHNANAVSGAATSWFLAEGSTGFFDTFLLFVNPDTTATADLSVSYLKPDGTTVPRSYSLAPGSRLTIWTNQEVPELANSAFSTLVTSTNGVGVVVERAMYFGPNWEGGHDSNAVTSASPNWFFAEGYTASNSTLDFDTFILLANPAATGTAHVTATFFLETGSTIVRTYDVTPSSRLNIWADKIPGIDAAPFSTRISSDVPIVAERAMYWGPPGGGWVDGHSAVGLTAEATKWAFAEGAEDGLDGSGLLFDSFFLVVNSTVNPLALRATFVREDGTGIVRTFNVNPQTRFTLITGAFPELSNQRFAAFLESTNGVPFVAERAVYWGSGYFGGHASPGVPWTGTIATPPPPPAPLVTGISPSAGFVDGGVQVTITGTGFAQQATVSFDGTPATGVAVVNSTTIRATTPAHAAATVDVAVRSNGQTATLTRGFTYVALPAPTIASVSPRLGGSAGGLQVTITGTNFVAGAKVWFGSTAATAVTFVDAFTLRVRSPAHIIGTVDIIVESNGIRATRRAAFTFAPLQVLAFGDSITYGTTSQVADFPLPLATISFIIPGYPERLLPMLQSRYGLPVTVQNEGLPGEFAFNATSRLPGLLTTSRDVVVILHGANDINLQVSTASIAADLLTMVQTAKASGSYVLLCTHPPALSNQKSDPAAIPPLNTEIRKIAVQEGVTLVDFYQSFIGNPGPLISADGLHPTAAGYDQMAQDVYNAIVSLVNASVAVPLSH